MNERESLIDERYRSEGWKMVRNGAPDFVAVKPHLDGGISIERGPDGWATNVLGVEVKSSTDRLTYEQAVWRELFLAARIPFKVEVVQ